MDTARWQALENGFATAHGLDGDERERWLATCAANDPELAREIRALLSAATNEGAIDRIAPKLESVRSFIDPDALGATAELPLPPRVGPYVVDREIGRGGMGIVCRAHDPRLGRDVALKIFPAAGAEGTDAEQRVLAEARAASALDHANICTIYDVGTLDDGRPYLAMAYYAGGTLAERLTNGPLGVDEATGIALQMADALACAHAAGIVHRDVKPRNVAFGDRGEAKLLDFGVALLRDQAGVPGSAGTPAYMAPEQVQGGPVDARADVWALGVMLFEMLTGRRPFGGETRTAVTQSILHDDPPDVRSLRPEVPASLASVVTRTLRKAPDERIGSAAALTDVLRAAAGHVAAQRPGRSAPRRRMVLAVAGLAIALSGLYAWRTSRQMPPAAQIRASGAASGLTDPGVADLFVRARERALPLDPEGNEEAIQLLLNILSSVPDYAPAHALLARAYTHAVSDGMSRQRDTVWIDSAFAHARRAVALAPMLADGHTALGYVHASRVQYAEAVPYYLRALELDPKNAQTMMDLSRSYMALDRFDEAVTWQERALVIDPLLPDARALVIARYNVWELKDHAWRHVSEGLRLVPTDVHLQSQAMLLELLDGDAAAARRRLDNMLPLLSPALRARMEMLFAMETRNPDAARPFMERIEGTGASTQEFLTYGMVYRATGDRQRGDSLVRLRLAALWAEDRRLGGRSTQVAAGLAHAYSVLGLADSSLLHFARWDSLGGVTSRRRMAREPGWATLRTHPRFESVMSRMHTRFENGQKLMRDRLTRDLPPDSATRARVVPAR